MIAYVFRIFAFILITSHYFVRDAVSAGMDLSVSLPAFGSYFPAEIYSMDLMPDKVRKSINEYIITNFTKTITDNIQFKRGCVIDPQKAPASGNPASAAPWYCLVFGIKLRNQIIDTYEFRIDLDGAGRILNAPELPQGACGRDFRFASRESIVGNVRKLMDNWDEMRAGYSAKFREPVIRFTKSISPWFGREYVRIVLVSACSGSVVSDERAYPIK